jgi:hypothetical protein
MELEVMGTKEMPDSAALVFFNLGKFTIDATDESNLTRHLADGLEGLSVFCQTQLEVHVITKLKLFYIGGIISAMCNKYRADVMQDKPHLAPRSVEIEVNDKLFKILATLNIGKLTAAMSDDFEGKDAGPSSASPARREFFRKWKFRILKFFEICRIEKKLIFTDLPFSFLTRVFPDLESTNRIFCYIRAHREEFPDWLCN